MFGLVPYIRRNTGLTKRGDIWGIDRLFDDFSTIHSLADG
jgi:hypothetical protein